MASLGCDGRRGDGRRGDGRRGDGRRVLLPALVAWAGGVAALLAVGAPPIAHAALPQKAGACPPLNKEACIVTCYEDRDCRGSYKCCKTQCAGSICVPPVSPPRFRRNETGVCPEKSSTPWVCGNRCSADDDCRPGSKCCVHRCGGRSCLRALPQPPFQPQPQPPFQPLGRAAPPQPPALFQPPQPPQPPAVPPYPPNADPRYPGEPVRFY